MSSNLLSFIKFVLLLCLVICLLFTKMRYYSQSTSDLSWIVSLSMEQNRCLLSFSWLPLLVYSLGQLGSSQATVNVANAVPHSSMSSVSPSPLTHRLSLVLAPLSHVTEQSDQQSYWRTKEIYSQMLLDILSSMYVQCYFLTGVNCITWF